MSAYISDSTLCCHWCKIPLGNASQVTYLNGNLPICDLCLSASASAEKDKRIAELEKKYEAYKVSNYDPSESIRLNGEIMRQKTRIAELESEILSLRHDKAIVDNYQKELEAQVEKMKCCGNCKWYKQGYSDKCYDLIVNKNCDKWEGV